MPEPGLRPTDPRHPAAPLPHAACPFAGPWPSGILRTIVYLLSFFPASQSLPAKAPTVQ